MTSDNPPFCFYDAEGIIYTAYAFSACGNRLRAVQVERLLVSDGRFIDAGAKLRGCVVGVRSRVGKQVALTDTVMFGSNHFESDEERLANERQGIPAIGVGVGSVIDAGDSRQELPRRRERAHPQ